KRLIFFPVSTFVVIISAEERVNALRAVPHVLVRLSGRIIHWIMLTWSRELCQFTVDARRIARRLSSLPLAIHRVELQRRRSGKRRRHHGEARSAIPGSKSTTPASSASSKSCYTALLRSAAGPPSRSTTPSSLPSTSPTQPTA